MRGSRLDLLKQLCLLNLFILEHSEFYELNKYFDGTECEEMSSQYLILGYKGGSSKNSRKPLPNFLSKLANSPLGLFYLLSILTAN